jgi:hypothetical protein
MKLRSIKSKSTIQQQKLRFMGILLQDVLFLNNQSIDSTIVISIDKLDEKLERISN